MRSDKSDELDRIETEASLEKEEENRGVLLCKPQVKSNILKSEEQKSKMAKAKENAAAKLEI